MAQKTNMCISTKIARLISILCISCYILGTLLSILDSCISFITVNVLSIPFSEVRIYPQSVCKGAPTKLNTNSSTNSHKKTDTPIFYLTNARVPQVQYDLHACQCNHHLTFQVQWKQMQTKRRRLTHAQRRHPHRNCRIVPYITCSCIFCYMYICVISFWNTSSTNVITYIPLLITYSFSASRRCYIQVKTSLCSDQQ